MDEYQEFVSLPDGYLLVSEAELATALDRWTEIATPYELLPTAAWLFAALVAAQEKGETGS